ncbi:hypothetical protein GQR58_014105 [Nymphon striatum]|nr:hypothetical protein GQR58_014105 [Nymphon striatum]
MPNDNLVGRQGVSENRRQRNIPLPQKLDIDPDNLKQNWKKFKKIWDSYEIVTDLKYEEAKYRSAVFFSCVGPDAIDIFEGLSFESESDKEDIDVILRKFTDYCVGETNETYEAFKFHKRVQATSEPFEAFISDLRRLIKTCNFGNMESRILRDQIVFGVQNELLRSKLLEVRQLTLDQCVDMCRAHEMSQLHANIMKADEVYDVQAVSNKKPFFRGNKFNRREKLHCKFCGKDHEAYKEKCPAYGKNCNKCSKRNHFAVCCKSTVNRVQAVESEESDECLEL